MFKITYIVFEDKKCIEVTNKNYPLQEPQYLRSIDENSSLYNLVFDKRLATVFTCEKDAQNMINDIYKLNKPENISMYKFNIVSYPYNLE